jgi:hypothetical protein
MGASRAPSRASRAGKVTGVLHHGHQRQLRYERRLSMLGAPLPGGPYAHLHRLLDC